MSLNYRNKVTYFSGILALMIVIRHSYNVAVYGLQGGALFWIEQFVYDFSDIIVPSFFAVSGYLFFQNYDHSKLLSKWKSRVFSILIPYLVWNGLAYLYYEVIALVPMVRASLNQQMEPFNLYWLLKNMLFGYHNVTWFLQNLMVYILVAPLFFNLLKKRTWSILFVVIIYIIGAIRHEEYGFFYNAPFYLSGAYMGIHYRELVQQRYTGKQKGIACVFIMITVLLNMTVGFLGPISRVPMRIAQAFALWVCADVLAVSKAPKWWQRISFFVYCSHSMILESVEKVFLLLFGKGTASAALDFFFAPVITVMIILVAASVCRQVKPAWRILTGNRGA